MKKRPISCQRASTGVDKIHTKGGATASMVTSARGAPPGVSRRTGPDGRRRATVAPPTVTSDAGPGPDLRRGGRTSRSWTRRSGGCDGIGSHTGVRMQAHRCAGPGPPPHQRGPADTPGPASMSRAPAGRHARAGGAPPLPLASGRRPPICRARTEPRSATDADRHGQRPRRLLPEAGDQGAARGRPATRWSTSAPTTRMPAICRISPIPAALAVGRGEVDRGIFVDGVGYGSAMIANKIHGVYAAVCQDPFCAGLARSHSNTNALCLGGKIIGSAHRAGDRSGVDDDRLPGWSRRRGEVPPAGRQGGGDRGGSRQAAGLIANPDRWGHH